MSNQKVIIALSIAMLIILSTISCRKSDYHTDSEKVIIADNGWGTGTVTWTRNKNYILDGLVFVNDGQILTIEAGTVIRGETGQGIHSSALIVARGGKIIAEGTPEAPIIFTCEGDDLKGSIPVLSKGLWGGLIILGEATINTESGESHIEGIPYYEPRGVFGGSNDNDNSGMLRYVSIRHGGTNIGEGNEINGLTLGGVGRGTNIEYIEVISNKDDGVEFFGGTVNTRYIVSAFNGDDAFDYDLGYSGKGQFWLGIQDVAEGDLLIEGDGGVDPELGLPYSIPVVYNGTFIGRGSYISNKTMQLGRNAGGKFANCIFMNQAAGVFIEYKPGVSDSYAQFVQGNLKLKNNIFWNIASNVPSHVFNVYSASGVDITVQNNAFKAYFSQAQNAVSDPGIMVLDNSFTAIPVGNIYENLTPITDPWFIVTDYKGAFGQINWVKNWTLLDQAGFVLN
jgi:hypothetical protein